MIGDRGIYFTVYIVFKIVQPSSLMQCCPLCCSNS